MPSGCTNPRQRSRQREGALARCTREEHWGCLFLGSGLMSFCYPAPRGHSSAPSKCFLSFDSARAADDSPSSPAHTDWPASLLAASLHSLLDISCPLGLIGPVCSVKSLPFTLMSFKCSSHGGKESLLFDKMNRKEQGLVAFNQSLHKPQAKWSWKYPLWLIQSQVHLQVLGSCKFQPRPFSVSSFTSLHLHRSSYWEFIFFLSGCRSQRTETHI